MAQSRAFGTPALVYSLLIGAAAISVAPPAPAVAPAFAEDRLHPLEAYCVEYRVSGVQSGTVIECQRGYGVQRVEIQDLKPDQNTDLPRLHHRVIHDSDTVIAIDLTTRRATRVRQDSEETLLTYVAGSDGTDIAEDFARALGGEATGENRQIAGETCEVWESQGGDLDASWCMTSDGLLLSFTMPQMMKKAVRVEVGTGGPSEHYRVPADVRIVDAGDPAAVNSMLGSVQ